MCVLFGYGHMFHVIVLFVYGIGNRYQQTQRVTNVFPTGRESARTECEQCERERNGKTETYGALRIGVYPASHIVLMSHRSTQSAIARRHTTTSNHGDLLGIIPSCSNSPPITTTRSATHIPARPRCPKACPWAATVCCRKSAGPFEAPRGRWPGPSTVLPCSQVSSQGFLVGQFPPVGKISGRDWPTQ